MDLLSEQKYMMRQEGEEGFSCLLNEHSCFQQMGFKALQNHGVQNLLECVKINFNGKIKLIYPAMGYRRLEQVLPLLDENKYLSIAVSLLLVIQNVQENSILKCDHLDISAGRIFIDWRTLDLHLVYLPVQDECIVRKGIEFDNMVRENLKSWANQTPASGGQIIRDFVRILDNNSYKLKDIAQVYGSWRHAPVTGPDGMQRKLILKGSSPGLFFEVNRQEFILGRSERQADGVILGDMQISRVHCRLYRENRKFYVEDLKSLSGTYVNGKKLTAHIPQELADGDVLKLSGTSFRIEMKEEK